MSEIRLLEDEIQRLKIEKDEREAALPAHTIRPHQLIAIEELENEISRKEACLLLQKTKSRGALSND